MSSYGEPNVQHKGAVQQIIDARQTALNAVSQARKLSLSTPHPNLAPTDGDGDAELASACSQAVVDYLLHLRPYRHQSENWNVDFGNIELPKQIEGKPSKRRGGWDKTGQPIWLCRQPQVPLTGLSTIIEVVNMTVVYSSNKRHISGSVTDDRLKINTEQYGTLVVDDRRLFNQVLSGEAAVEEIADHPSVHPYEPRETEQQSYTPAEPPRNGNGTAKSYKIVLPDDQLLRLFEAADEIAGEVDMLAEIEPPDHSSGGGDAV